MQSGVQEWKARIAIRSNNDEQAGGTNLSTAVPSLAPYLCYVCHTTFTSKGARAPPPLYSDNSELAHEFSPLPTWTTSARPFRLSNEVSPVVDEPDPDGNEFTVTRKLPRSEMRDVVNKFLLDE